MTTAPQRPSIFACMPARVPGTCARCKKPWPLHEFIWRINSSGNKDGWICTPCHDAPPTKVATPTAVLPPLYAPATPAWERLIRRATRLHNAVNPIILTREDLQAIAERLDGHLTPTRYGHPRRWERIASTRRPSSWVVDLHEAYGLVLDALTYGIATDAHLTKPWVRQLLDAGRRVPAAQAVSVPVVSAPTVLPVPPTTRPLLRVPRRPRPVSGDRRPSCGRATSQGTPCRRLTAPGADVCVYHEQFDARHPDRPSIPADPAWAERTDPPVGSWVRFARPFTRDGKVIDTWRRVSETRWSAPGAHVDALEGWRSGDFAVVDDPPTDATYQDVAPAPPGRRTGGTRHPAPCLRRVRAAARCTCPSDYEALTTADVNSAWPAVLTEATKYLPNGRAQRRWTAKVERGEVRVARFWTGSVILDGASPLDDDEVGALEEALAYVTGQRACVFLATGRRWAA